MTSPEQRVQIREILSCMNAAEVASAAALKSLQEVKAILDRARAPHGEFSEVTCAVLRQKVAKALASSDLTGDYIEDIDEILEEM